MQAVLWVEDNYMVSVISDDLDVFVSICLCNAWGFLLEFMAALIDF